LAGASLVRLDELAEADAAPDELIDRLRAGLQARLRLVHTGLAGDLGVLHEDGWSCFLARLAAGGELAAYPAERPDERLTTLRQQGHKEGR
jgi:hypothetical protein